MLEVWWLVDTKTHTHVVLDPYDNPFDRDILDSNVIRDPDKEGEATNCNPYFYRLGKRVPCKMKERTWFV